MAAITATPIDAPRTGSRRARDRALAATAMMRRHAATAVSAARHRSWSPALTVGGFALVDTAAFQLAAGHLSPGIGLLVTGISAWLFDWSRD